MPEDATIDQGAAVRGVAAGIVDQAPKPGPEPKRLEAIIGRWMTEGLTIAGAGAPAVKIVASDVYEWAPGGFFVVHPAYGRIGDVGAGGIEIIGYDAASKQCRGHFFDSQGNVSTLELTVRDGVWTWRGERTRCTGVFSDDGKSMAAHHERSDDGVTWVPSMDVTLTKVE